MVTGRAIQGIHDARECAMSANEKMTRRTFAFGAAAAAALTAAGLAVPAIAEEGEEDAVEEGAAGEMPDTITGASTVIDEALQLTQEEIRELALDYLKGWPLKTDEDGNEVYSYREMYAIATSYNNHPGLSQVEFVLDPNTLKLVCSSEKGTEKCEHIKYNPEVVLYWYYQIPGRGVRCLLQRLLQFLWRADQGHGAFPEPGRGGRARQGRGVSRDALRCRVVGGHAYRPAGPEHRHAVRV